MVIPKKHITSLLELKEEDKDLLFHIFNKINEIGNRYGRLTVIDLANSDNQGHAYWRCICDCGNTKICKAKL